MKEKDCKIVQDLLPNYIDKLTNEETNIFIEEHLSTCEECRNILENMRKEIDVTDNKREEKEVNYIKKYSIRLKIFKALAIMFLLVVLFFILSIERRMVILTSLMNKVKEIDYSNSCVGMKILNEHNSRCSIRNSYLKDNVELSITESFLGDRNLYMKQIDYYKNEEEQFCVQETCNLEKQVFSNNYMSPNASHGSNELALMGVGLSIQTLEDYFDYVFNSSIDNLKYEGKECYVIKNGAQELIVEKSTGLVLRVVVAGTEPIDIRRNDLETYISTVIYYRYSFGTVTDKDIEKPDISGYKKYGE